MKIDPQNGSCPYGARLMLGHLESFQNHIEGGKKAQDIENIHQLRVYSRRLRCALQIFIHCLPSKEAKQWTKKIKKITQSLGTARDLDVQIESLEQFKQNLPEKKFEQGIQRIILRHLQRREIVQQGVIKTLDQLVRNEFINEIHSHLLPLSQAEDIESNLPIQLYRLSFEVISDKLQNLLTYDEFVYDPKYVKELHEMRIAAKNLRYTIEIFAPIYLSKLKTPYQTIRETQEMLGTIHDCDVWIDLMVHFKEEEKQRILDFYGQSNTFNFILPGLEFFEESRQVERNITYEKFRNAWTEWKTKRIWENLIDTIEMPSYPKDALTN